MGGSDAKRKPLATRSRQRRWRGTMRSGAGLIPHPIAAPFDDNGFGVVEQAVE
jgi:hypothetical protein